MKVPLDNVQTVVIQMLRATLSRHLLFAFGPDVAGARAFMREVAPLIAVGAVDVNVTDHRPLLALGLTAGGLAALGLDAGVVSKLDSAYRQGPDPDALSDVAGSPSALSAWWEGQFQTTDVHLVISVNVDDAELLETTSRDLRERAKKHGVRELVPRADGTTLDGESMGGGLLHFGYRDGFSQPTIDWDDDARTPGGLDFRNFVLGYAGSDVLYSSPGPGESSKPAADYVRDSSYAVFRWLYQDVARFNAFLAEHGPKLFPELSAADAEERLAAKMMGRWRDGTPLVESPDAPASSFTNGFGYAEDPQGLRCPFSAHVRVVNPRDEPLDPVVAPEGVPRVLRRGMPYGKPLEGLEDDGVDRGLAGVFLCTSFRRQFYKLCSWISANTFSPVYAANRRVQDALMGNRAYSGADPTFIVPHSDGSRSIPGLPDFIRTKGTLFLLIPSLATMERLGRESAA